VQPLAASQSYDVRHSPFVKVRDILKRLAEDGWTLKTTAGSDRQFTHPTTPGKVTVSSIPADDVQGWLLASIWKQAGLK